MKKKVRISVQGTQKYDGQSPETVELVSWGTMEPIPEGYRLSYEESEMTGMEGVTTTFEARKDSVILRRTGAVSSNMVFRLNEKHESLYDLGFGALLMGVQARHIANHLQEDGGVLELEYGIEIEHQFAGTNAYKITVRQ